MLKTNTNNRALAVRVMCSIIFLTFTFVYLCSYQADVIAVQQHILSAGKTNYNAIMGAIIITIVLYVLQVLIYALTKLSKYSHALTYFPSLIALIILPNLSTITAGLWVLVLFIVLIYASLIWFIKGLLSIEYAYPVKVFAVNVLSMTIMLLTVGLLSSGNQVYHYRARAERFLIDGDYNAAARVGILSQKTDSSLTMIRIYALSHMGKLGEKLFEYNLVGDSKVLLPNGKGVRMLMYPEQKLYQYLGARSKGSFTSMVYLNFLQTLGKAKQPVADYVLIGCLLDKNLNGFVNNITKYYKTNGNLPKHYREALTLYTHTRSNPAIIFHDDVMDTDFQDYQNLEKKYSDKVLRQAALRDTYGNTYWYYYQYALLGGAHK